MVSSGVMFDLVGIFNDPEYQRCRLILQELSILYPTFLFRLHGVLENEFLDLVHTHRDIIPKDTFRQLQQSTHPFILRNQSEYMNGEDELLDFAVGATQLSRNEILAGAAFGAKEYTERKSMLQLELAEETLQIKVEAAASEALFHYREMSGNLYAYLVFEVDGVTLPRVELELFHRVCPKTCENFMAFCTGQVPDIANETTMLSYKGNVVHRVVRGGWIQAGDVSNNGRGDGPSRSLYGREFADESFAISHDRPGILAMANTGPHTNGSQFFITLSPLPWLDRKKGTYQHGIIIRACLYVLQFSNSADCWLFEWIVAFGRVVSGMHTIMTIGNLETLHDRPCVPCKIVDSGRSN